MNHPEWELQVQIAHTVRDHVPMPHLFFSVDRSKRLGRFSHVREKARGMMAGVPDTILIYPGFPVIAIELKAKGERVEPGSTQERVGHAIQAAYGHWTWVDSVHDYMLYLNNIGIPLHGRWDLTAAHRDALLASAAIKREEAGGVVSKKRLRGSKAHVDRLEKAYRKPEAKASPARIRKAERIRAGGVRRI